MEVIQPLVYEPNPINMKIAYHEQTLKIGYNQALTDILTYLDAEINQTN